jgi:hypothetical protein
MSSGALMTLVIVGLIVAVGFPLLATLALRGKPDEQEVQQRIRDEDHAHD